MSSHSLSFQYDIPNSSPQVSATPENLQLQCGGVRSSAMPGVSCGMEPQETRCWVVGQLRSYLELAKGGTDISLGIVPPLEAAVPG